MPYTITSNCIICNRCLVQFPASANRNLGLHYWIDQNICNDCADAYRVSHRTALSPTNADTAKAESSKAAIQSGVAVLDLQVSGQEQVLGLRFEVPAFSESHSSVQLSGQEQVLRMGFERPAASGISSLNADYWESWFNTYNRSIAQMNQAKETPYWERWFKAYSQVLPQQIRDRHLQAPQVEV